MPTFICCAFQKYRTYLREILGQSCSLIDLHRFHEFSLDVSSLIVTTSAFVKKKRSKMRHLNKFVQSMSMGPASFL